MTFLDARRIALALPGVEKGPSYGTSGFRVSGKLFARVKEDGVTLVVRTDRDTREALLEANPSTFFVTPHYRGYVWIAKIAAGASDGTEPASTRLSR
jgi:hypothetical protein